MRILSTVVILLFSLFCFALPSSAQADITDRMGTEFLDFNIEAGSLQNGLKQYNKATGIDLRYSAELVDGKKTGGIQGKKCLANALETILAGTGLSYKAQSGAIVLFPEKNKQATSARTNIELAKTVVTATKTKHIVGDVPISTTVITKEELESQNIHNLADAMKMISGLYQYSTGVKIYGLDIEHTSLLIDGQKQYKCPGRMPILDRYPIEMIERIEIKKGASGVLNGGETSGGVIHVITKSGSEKSTFSASTGFGSHGKQVHHIGGGGKVDNLKYRFDVIDNKYHGTSSEDAYTYDDFWGSFDYEFSPELETTLKTAFYNQDSEDWKQRKYSLNSITKWEPDAVSKLVFRQSLLRLLWTESEMDLNTYETEVYYNRAMFGKHLATIGYQYQGDFPESTTNQMKNQNTNNIYVQDEIVLKPVTLLLGVRWVEHNWWGNDFFPQAGVLYRMTDKLKLRASVERGFRSVKACYAFDGIKFLKKKWTRVDDDLEPETSLSYQAGLEYQINEKILATVSLFHNDLENKIDVVRTSETYNGKPVYLVQNIADVRTQGGEINFVFQICEGLSAKLGYYYLYSENRETGNDLTYDPEHMANFNLYYENTEYGLGINLGAEYIGERYADEDNTEKLSSYFLANIKITKDISKNIEGFFEVNNIFNEEYMEDDEEMPGAEIFGGIKLHF